MPTVGRTMTNEHFRDLTGGVRIRSPLIWECTRFCLAPDAPAGRGGGAAGGGVELGLRFGLEQAVGVIYAKTRAALPAHRLRARHHRLAAARAATGSASASGRSGGGARRDLATSGIPLSVMARWFDASFPARVLEERIAA